MNFDEFMEVAAVLNVTDPHIILNHDSVNVDGRYADPAWGYTQLKAAAVAWLQYIVRMGYPVSPRSFLCQKFSVVGRRVSVMHLSCGGAVSAAHHLNAALNPLPQPLPHGRLVETCRKPEFGGRMLSVELAFLVLVSPSPWWQVSLPRSFQAPLDEMRAGLNSGCSSANDGIY